MTAYQRRRGMPATVYLSTLRETNRGEKLRFIDRDNPIHVTVWLYYERSYRGEVPGQQEIDTVRIGVDPSVPKVDSWAQVDFMDTEWDVLGPPAFRNGSSRHVRHWSIQLRRRTAKNGPS